MQATAGKRQAIATRLCTRAGIVGPVLFFVVFTIDGALTPGYSAWAEPISYLELGPAGWVQVANFIVLGVLLAAFAFAFFRRVRGRLGGVSPAASTILLVVSGLGYVMAGLFVTPRPGSRSIQCTQSPSRRCSFRSVSRLS